MTAQKTFDPAETRLCDRTAVALLVVCTAIVFAVFRDYGLGWDDYAHAQYGDLLVSYYATGMEDTRALSFINLYKYGGGFDLAAALTAKILPFTVFETRRLLGGLTGIVGLIAVWRAARRLSTPFGGLAATALLAACPLYVGHVFMNAKDGPFAVAMAVLMCGLVRMVEEYPRPHWTTRILVGLGLGLSIGSRVMGGFGVVAALCALVYVLILDARSAGIRIASAKLGQFTLAMLPAALLGYAVMALVWPWGVVDPLNPFRALVYFAHFFEQPWEELFGGQIIMVTDMPRRYVPTLFALKLPLVFLALTTFGMAGAAIAACMGGVARNRRALLACVVILAIAPVAAAVLARPAMYNSIRHFVFVMPPRAVLGGLACAWVYDWASQRGRLATVLAGLVFIAGLALPLAEMVRLHPYEYTHFNRLAGGVAGARANYMLDYWGLSFKQASQGLAAKLAELKLHKPPDRRWKLAVCGPHPSPEVELGPDFEVTGEPKGADFAMLLGTFYCARLDAPMWVEVERAGVVYATVYDIRGLNIETLLTRPPIGTQ
jgi:hypothetical protein